MEIQRQTAFEQDDRHGNRDERLHQSGELHVRLHQTRHRPGKRAGRQKQNDGGKLKAPGEPLGGNAGCGDHGDGGHDIGHARGKLPILFRAR